MTEDQSLADFLNDIQASRDVIQQALRLYVAQKTDYLPAEDMLEELVAKSHDASQVDRNVATLAQSSDDLEEAALTYLSAAWTAPDERERIRAAFAAANKSLPIIDSVVLATVAMYAMYLFVTGGKAKETRTVSRGADDSFTEKVETIYASPKPWLQNVFGLLGREQSQDASEF